MKTKIYILVISAILFLDGCSGPPSEADGRAAIEKKILRESNGLIQLVSFQKTDGVLQEVMGMKLYQLKYKAEIKFIDNCYWGDGGDMFSGWQGSFNAERPSGMDLSMVYRPRNKGQCEQVMSTLTFQKTENGWNLAQ